MPRRSFRPPVGFYVLALGLGAGLPGRAPAQAAVPPSERYATVAGALERLIDREVANKGLPALSIALIDDQTIVWAKGFGHSQPKNKVPATAETVYRVGSVSKLFTDIGIMQLVEGGVLDL